MYWYIFERMALKGQRWRKHTKVRRGRGQALDSMSIHIQWKLGMALITPWI